MTGPEHFKAAERTLEAVHHEIGGVPGTMPEAQAAYLQRKWAYEIASAQVHATLALAALTADAHGVIA